jgi:hypothetical protein
MKRAMQVVGLGAGLMLCAAASAQTVWTAHYDNGSLSPTKHSGNSPQVQTSARRAGKGGMMSILDYSWSNNFRTEVSFRVDGPYVDKDYWYGFSILLPNGYSADKVWETLVQWHHIRDTGDTTNSPPLKLQSTNGVWMIENWWNPNRKSLHGDSKMRRFHLGPYATGRWTDFVFRIRWSYGSGGVLEVWQNGRKVVSATGPNTYNDAKMPWLKYGIYKGWKSRSPDKVKRRVVFHDEVRIQGPGGSYSRVAPSGTSSVTMPSGVKIS